MISEFLDSRLTNVIGRICDSLRAQMSLNLSGEDNRLLYAMMKQHQYVGNLNDLHDEAVLVIMDPITTTIVGKVLKDQNPNPMLDAFEQCISDALQSDKVPSPIKLDISFLVGDKRFFERFLPKIICDAVAKEGLLQMRSFPTNFRMYSPDVEDVEGLDSDYHSIDIIVRTYVPELVVDTKFGSIQNILVYMDVPLAFKQIEKFKKPSEE